GAARFRLGGLRGAVAPAAARRAGPLEEVRAALPIADLEEMDAEAIAQVGVSAPAAGFDRTRFGGRPILARVQQRHDQDAGRIVARLAAAQGERPALSPGEVLGVVRELLAAAGLSGQALVLSHELA